MTCVALMCDLVNHVACIVLDHVRSRNHDDIMVCCSGCIWFHANKIAYVRWNQSQKVVIITFQNLYVYCMLKGELVECLPGGLASSHRSGQTEASDCYQYIRYPSLYIMHDITRLIQDVPITMVPMGQDPAGQA